MIASDLLYFLFLVSFSFILFYQRTLVFNITDEQATNTV